MPCILLLDNGSYRASATLKLRALAEKLTLVSGVKIHPVSCQHSDQVPAIELNGQSAYTFTGFMEKQLSAGENEFIVLPLFFGRSRAITGFIPKEAAQLAQTFGPFNLNIADVIYPLPEGEDDLTTIIHDHILLSSAKSLDGNASVNNFVLIDHGSPVPRVTAVRKHLVASVRKKMDRTYALDEAVMERRAGEKYDFNGELLQDWLTQKAQLGGTRATVILMFFLPGSHAGEGGDIVEICDAVMSKYPTLKVTISPLISEHPKLVSILNSRLQSALEA